MKIYNNKIKLIIDDSVLLEYEKYYFKIHPKAYKKPIKKPNHPSINEWMILHRQSMNSLKQKWKDFIVWFVKYSGYSNLHIDKCEIEYITYFKINRRHDIDNTVPKFILDGLVEAGLIVDDDYKHLKRLILECGYDKKHPRTEIIIRY